MNENEKNLIDELWGADRREYSTILDSYNICGRDRIKINEYLVNQDTQDYEEFEKKLLNILKY